MRHAVALLAVAVVACAKTETKVDTSAAAAAKTVAAAPAIALGDFAGKWNVVGKSETGDTTLATYVMTASADPNAWTIAFPNRPVLPAKVAAMGDSLSVDFGPYESVLRKGVQVTTHTVYHPNAGRLVGMTVAHYSVKTADSVRNIRSEATKAP